MQLFFEILQALGLLLSVALGLFTLSRNPKSPVNIGFALGMSSVAAVQAGGGVMLLSARGVAASGVGADLFTAAQAMLPACWLLFCVSFARGETEQAGDVIRRHLPVLAATAAAGVFFTAWAFTEGLVDTSPLASPSLFDTAPGSLALTEAGRYFYIYMILGLVLNMAYLESTLRSSRGGKRWKVKYVIFGVGSVLAFFIYLASHAIMFKALSFETIPLTSAVVVISAAMMGFYIIRHRLLDADVFVSRYVVYNSVTVLAVGVYLLAVGLVTQGIRYFDLPFDHFFTTLFIFVALLALVVVLFTTRVRRRVQHSISRHFYKHKYEFRDKWLETIDKIGSRRSVEGIKNTLKEMIAHDMGARPVYLWVFDPKTRSYVTQDDVPAAMRAVPEDVPFVELMRSGTDPLSLEDIAGADAFSKGLSDSGCVVCSPLSAGGDLIGFVSQGTDVSGEPYMTDDFEFLRAVTAQAAVQIKNINLARELMAAKEVEAFSRMSSFIMHDLKNLTNSLSLVSQNARSNMDNPEFQRDAIRTVDGTVRRMKSVIGRLSRVRRGMDLKRTDCDLGALIEKALRETAPPEGKDVNIAYEPDPGAGTVFVDPEALEMVILNLVSNACDSIDGSGSVRVGSSRNGRYASVTVSDDGAGMSEDFMRDSLFRPFKSTKKSGFGIGLYQCRTLVEAHGGEIEVESEPGRGTTFTVKLPAEPGDGAEAHNTPGD